MIIPNRRYPFILSTLLVIVLALFTSTGCDDTTSPPTEISVRITQPTDSSTIRDTVLRILTEISSNCGCQAYVEFHIDGVHQYSDYLPFYHYDWNIRDLEGWHTIATRVVVTNRGDAWDSVRVLLTPP